MSRWRRPGLRGRSVRLRFTVMYTALFLLSGAGLLAITNALAVSGVRHTTPAGDPPRQPPPAAAAQERVAQLQAELDRVHAQQLRQLLTGSVIALVAMLAISAVLGRVVAGRVLRPLRAVTTATRRISADNLH